MKPCLETVVFPLASAYVSNLGKCFLNNRAYMEKIKFILLSLSMFAGLTACNHSEDPMLEISSAELKVEASGCETTLLIKANGDWTIQTDGQSWYSVNPLSGSGPASVLIKVEAYDEVNGRSATLKISSGSLLKTLAITQMRPTPPSNPVEETVTVRARGGERRFVVPEGFAYKVAIPEDAQDWISVLSKDKGTLTLNFKTNATEDYRTAKVIAQTTDGAELAAFDISQSWRNIEPGELLIEEIYYTSTLTETGRPEKYHGDQFFKLTNNCDNPLYIDGVMIMETKYVNTWNYEFIVPIKDEYVGVGTVTCIPGSGTDVLLEPGKSVIIANNAQDYLHDVYEADGKTLRTKGNPNSFDLSKADFEWYDESTNNVKDIDNPLVPNLDKWYCYTLSIWVLHNRGFQSYAIGLPPATVDKKKFLSDYKWEGEYINHTLAGDFQMRISKAYKVPNKWILDAVNCTVESKLVEFRLSETLDAGFTYCGEQNIDSDPTRFNKSVRRKKDGSTGKLVDTNNSTNDFTPNATPSLR